MTSSNENRNEKIIRILKETIIKQNVIIADLKTSKKSKSKRMIEVLNILKDEELHSILEMSEKLNISTKNISSQLTYLRKEGHMIVTINQDSTSYKKLLVK